MITLALVPPDEINQVWPEVKPLLKKAMVRLGVNKSFDLGFVFDQIKSGRWHCWIGSDLDGIKVAYATHVGKMPKRAVFYFDIIGAKKGTIDGWLQQHFEIFNRVAKDLGCTAIRGEGRSGWGKKLNPDRQWVQYEFEVE